MDTLTHAVSGAVLACAITPRAKAAGALGLGAAATVGAVAGAFPDIDIVTQWWGDFAYLRHHRGVTHSVPMAPLWALALAALLAPAFAATRRTGGWKTLFPVALGAILVHIAGDWITQFGTLLLAPFSDARFGLGAMFIIDLVFSGLLLLGLLLSFVWRRSRLPALASLALAAGWVGLARVGKQEAEAIGARWAEANGVAARWVETMPRPASPFNWTVAVFDGERYHLAHLNTRRSAPLVAGPDANFVRRFSAPFQPAAQARWERVPMFGQGSPDWVREAWAHPSFETYRWFARAPALVRLVEATAEGGERCAVFRDLRFEFPGREEAPFRFGVCLQRDGAARVVRLEGERLTTVQP